MKTLRILPLLLAMLGTAQAEDAQLFFSPIIGVPAPGESFELGLYVTDGSLSIGAYALRLVYNPKVIQVQEISGGKDPVYDRRPVSVPETYATGITDFTAVKADEGETPDTYQIARIRFMVVGESGTAAVVEVQPSPEGGLVEQKHYRLVTARMPPLLRLGVSGNRDKGGRRAIAGRAID